MKNRTDRIFFYLSLLILLTGVMLVCSVGTSPLYPHNFSYDSALFRFFGKEILKGKTPYLDIWDHKGPVLYFIQAVGALGGCTNKGTNVLFLMQLLSMYLSFFFLFKTYLLLTAEKSSLWKFTAITICSLSVLGLTIESGNLSEEWCLPMTCCSFYLIAAYAQQSAKSHEHPPIHSFIHGIGLGMMTMIRPNNALPVCAGLFVIGLDLIFNKMWKNILKNVLTGLLGICCIWLPVILWFYARGALNEMIYAAFTFNLNYSAYRAHTHYTGTAFITRYLPILLSALSLAVFWLKKRTFQLFDGIMAAILTISAWMLLTTNVYLHYFTIFIPVLFLVFACCSNRYNFPGTIILLILCVWFGWQHLQRIPDLISLHRQPPMFTETEKIPVGERNAVIAVNMPPELYLNYGLEPVSRFCAYQHVHFGTAPELKLEFLDTLEQNPPNWILAFCSGETHIPEVQELIDRDYIYRFDQSDICYYQHKQ